MDTRQTWPIKFKPWEREKLIGKKAPHPVDERYGFCDSLRWAINENTKTLAIRQDFDRLRLGVIENGKRYLGEGCWQKIETHIP
jgi:hypothetical protein